MHEQLQHEKEDQQPLVPLVSRNKELYRMNTVYGLIVGFGIGVITAVVCKWSFGGSAKTLAKHVKRKNGNYKLVLVVRNELGMGKGKIAAQCSHAALGCYKIAQKMTPDVVQYWESIGQPKIVLKLDTPGEEGLYKLMEESRKRSIASTVIRDAGHTQVERGTATVAGIGPYEAEMIDEITGHLKLL